MLLFFALLSMVLLFRALDRGGFWVWAAYAAVTAVSLYVHYFALLMPPVPLVYLLLNRVPRKKWLAWLASMAVVGLSFAPWVVAVYMLRVRLGGLGSISNGVHIGHLPYSVFGIVNTFIFFLMVFVIGYGQTVGNAAGILGVASAIIAGSWPLVILFGLVARSAAKWLRGRSAVFLLAWLFLTVGL